MSANEIWQVKKLQRMIGDDKWFSVNQLSVLPARFRTTRRSRGKWVCLYVRFLFNFSWQYHQYQYSA